MKKVGNMMQITTAKSGTYIAHKMILHIKSMFFRA